MQLHPQPRLLRLLCATLVVGAFFCASGSAFAQTLGPATPALSWPGRFYASSHVVDESLCPSEAVDPIGLVCDHAGIDVQASGRVDLRIAWPDPADDFDLYVYDAAGNLVASSSQAVGTSERVVFSARPGRYEERVIPVFVGSSGYSARARFQLSGLVAAYGFDEGSGSSAADSSGSGNAGTISGAGRTAGKDGDALSFDGVNDWVTVPDSSSLDLTSGLTLEAWINPAAFGPAWTDVLMKEGSGSLAYALYANSNGNVPTANLFLGSEFETFGYNPLPLSTWTHLAATYDGSAVRLYANGTQIASHDRTGSITPSTGPLRIGGDSLWGEWFNGRIDSVRIYKRALSAAEIKSDTTAPVAAPAPTDTTPPSVALDAPAAGAKVSGSLTVSATASDGGGVAGVQFELDGAKLGPEDTTAPYAVSWDSTAALGDHTLSAVARDTAGNLIRSAPVDVTATATATATASGLVAAYGFGEGAGATVADSSGNGNAGTISGAAWTSAGKDGGALSFDGVNDYVTVPDSSSLDLTSALTLEAWVNPASFGPAYTSILMKEGSGWLTYALYANSKQNVPTANLVLGSEVETFGYNPLPLNTWTHLAATYDGSVVCLYANGTRIAAQDTSGALAASSGPLRIGGDSLWGEWFNGRIDSVRIYKRALSPAEIRADMNSSP